MRLSVSSKASAHSCASTKAMKSDHEMVLDSGWLGTSNILGSASGVLETLGSLTLVPGCSEALIPLSRRTRSVRVRNCKFEKTRFTSSWFTPSIFRSSRVSGNSRSRTSRFSRRLRIASCLCSLRLSPTFPPIESTESSIASSVWCSCSHFAAVLGPTPGIPGRLSELSPTSAARSEYWLAWTPYFA